MCKIQKQQQHITRYITKHFEMISVGTINILKLYQKSKYTSTSNTRSQEYKRTSNKSVKYKGTSNTRSQEYKSNNDILQGRCHSIDASKKSKYKSTSNNKDETITIEYDRVNIFAHGVIVI